MDDNGIIYLVAGVVGSLSVLFNFIVLTRLGNSVKVTLQNMVQGGRIANVMRRDGSSYLENQHSEDGFLEGKGGRWELCDEGVIRGADYPYVLEHENFGMVYTGRAASCAAVLRNWGFNNLAEAVSAWDQKYMDKHKLELGAIEADTKLTPEGKRIKIESIRKQGRGDLITLNFEYVNDWVIPLHLLTGFCAINKNPLNQKNQIRKKELQVRESMAKLQTALLTPNNVLMFIMILVGGAVAVMIVTNNNIHF